GLLEFGEAIAHLLERRRVLLLERGRRALDHLLGLPHETARILILDRLCDAALHNRFLVFIRCALEEFERGLGRKAVEALLFGLEPCIRRGKRVLDLLPGARVFVAALL